LDDDDAELYKFKKEIVANQTRNNTKLYIFFNFLTINFNKRKHKHEETSVQLTVIFSPSYSLIFKIIND